MPDSSDRDRLTKRTKNWTAVCEVLAAGSRTMMMHADTTAPANTAADDTAEPESSGYRFQTLPEIERQVIESRLRAFNGNKVKAAASLGISRATLYYRINAWKVVDAKVGAA